MPTPEIPHISTHNDTLLELGAGLANEMLGHYIDWRTHAAAAAHAYHVWQRAPAAQEAAHFAAYMTALDKEEAAAARYAMVVETSRRAV
jgi:hypothetical protein